MRTELFDYELPEELIAQRPLIRRDGSRLMVVDRFSGSISHRTFRDLPGLLTPRDCLVVNNSRVIPARLTARKETGGAVELLLLEQLSPGRWKVMSKGSRLRPGVRLEVGLGLMAVIEEGPDAGVALVLFEADAPGADIGELLESAGSVPLPPYIHEPLDEDERYQTVYSRREMSAAAPTAGLHFTDALLAEIKSLGVTVAELELAVGMDTFVPVREEDTDDHHMHEEYYSVGRECATAVNGCTGRVVAVGTTTVRALESAALEAGPVERVAAAGGRTSLFITPGYDFRAVDALLTNFHFPCSTLIMLVSAFAGRELLLEAYRQAVQERYRFYSFGDAMLVL